MNYNNKVKDFDPFRPLKDFEDQIDEVFVRREMQHNKRKSKSRLHLKSHNDFLVEDDAKEIESSHDHELIIPLHSLSSREKRVDLDVSQAF